MRHDERNASRKGQAATNELSCLHYVHKTHLVPRHKKVHTVAREGDIVDVGVGRESGEDGRGERLRGGGSTRYTNRQIRRGTPDRTRAQNWKGRVYGDATLCEHRGRRRSPFIPPLASFSRSWVTCSSQSTSHFVDCCDSHLSLPTVPNSSRGGEGILAENFCASEGELRDGGTFRCADTPHGLLLACGILSHTYDYCFIRVRPPVAGLLLLL